MNLSFLRGSTGGSDDSIYTSKTEVWVCGDIAGYRHWIELLRLSAAGAQAKRINPEILGLYSMSLVLQQRVRHREAIVDFSERLYHRPSPVMELVINATTYGYRKMADKIEEFTNLLNDDPDDHIHLDAGMVPWVTATSIALNVRGPMWFGIPIEPDFTAPVREHCRLAGWIVRMMIQPRMQNCQSPINSASDGAAADRSGKNYPQKWRRITPALRGFPP